MATGNAVAARRPTFLWARSCGEQGASARVARTDQFCHHLRERLRTFDGIVCTGRGVAPTSAPALALDFVVGNVQFAEPQIHRCSACTECLGGAIANATGVFQRGYDSATSLFWVREDQSSDWRKRHFLALRALHQGRNGGSMALGVCTGGNPVVCNASD
jgi:hypothetical protein